MLTYLGHKSGLKSGRGRSQNGPLGRNFVSDGLSVLIWEAPMLGLPNAGENGGERKGRKLPRLESVTLSSHCLDVEGLAGVGLYLAAEAINHVLEQDGVATTGVAPNAVDDDI